MSIKKNFAYSFLLTASGYIFPMLTYPYVARTLGVSSIGVCDFVDSIINYFILVSMMGITACGIREIAATKEDSIKRSSIFTSLLTLNAISTSIAIVALLFAMYTIPSLQPHKTLLWIGICKLLSNMFLVEWFFTGMENFAYITKRSLTIKFLYVVGIFLFIHEPKDYPIYYLLTVGSVVLNALWNFCYSQKFITIRFDNITLNPFLATFFSIGIYKIITAVYTTLNVSWLGFMTNTDQVGYYTSATRLYTIIISVFTAFTGVMLPRLSSLHAEGKEHEFWQKIDLSVEALCCFAFPMVLLSVIFAPNILHFLLGDGFELSYLPFRIIAPLIFIIGYEQILVMQILIPRKHDKIVLRNSIIGALVAVVANILFVKAYGATGSALVWLTSEIAVLIATLVFTQHNTQHTIPYKRLKKYTLAYLPLTLALIVVYTFATCNDFAILCIAGMVTFTFSFFAQKYYVKSPIALPLINKLSQY